MESSCERVYLVTRGVDLGYHVVVACKGTRQKAQEYIDGQKAKYGHSHHCMWDELEIREWEVT